MTTEWIKNQSISVTYAIPEIKLSTNYEFYSTLFFWYFELELN